MPAQVQFLAGSRDQDVADLNDQASLTLGSGDDAHIRCTDPGIDPQHCRIYCAEGGWWLQNLSATTVFDMRRVAPNTIEQLQDKQVFIVGRTFVKFWKDGAPSGGGGGGGDAAGLEQQLATARQELDELRAAHNKTKEAGEEQRRAAETAQAEVKDLEGKLSELRKEAESLKKAKEEAEGARHGLEGELTQAKADAEKRITEAKEEAERQVAEAKEELEAERSELRSSLEATRASLESLRAEQEGSGRDSLAQAAEPSDLAAALDALGVSDAVRGRVESAVAAEVEREVTRRLDGPVVPVRGLRLAGGDRDLEAELANVRRREERVETARRLGLHELESDELQRLIGMARS